MAETKRKEPDPNAVAKTKKQNGKSNKQSKNREQKQNWAFHLNRHKNETKKRRQVEHIVWFVSFVHGRFACVATRIQIQFGHSADIDTGTSYFAFIFFLACTQQLRQFIPHYYVRSFFFPSIQCMIGLCTKRGTEKETERARAVINLDLEYGACKDWSCVPLSFANEQCLLPSYALNANGG